MRLNEAQSGVQVEVSGRYGRYPELCGLTGTIVQQYGPRNYPLLEVRLENGRSELFWHYELEAGKNSLSWPGEASGAGGQAHEQRIPRWPR